MDSSGLGGRNDSKHVMLNFFYQAGQPDAWPLNFIYPFQHLTGKQVYLQFGKIPNQVRDDSPFYESRLMVSELVTQFTKILIHYSRFTIHEQMN